MIPPQHNNHNQSLGYKVTISKFLGTQPQRQAPLDVYNHTCYFNTIFQR
jgi:hypothetical protein